MRRRRLSLLAAVALILLVPVAVANAFVLANVDGVWGTIDTDGATGDRWGTGPASSPGSPTHTDGSDPTVQSQDGLTSDLNQVRYGSPSTFGSKSGFGFDGANNAPPITPGELEPFFLGHFTHYNMPIQADNNFDWVDLTVSVPVDCDPDNPPGPLTMTFTYRFTLDETTNAAPCVYGSDGDEPCPDKVTVSSVGNLHFSCDEGDYTIAILGFTTEGLGGAACHESYNSSAVSAQYVTQESEDNSACLWAEITEFVATAVDLISFTATPEGDAIRLDWGTGSEIDNLGFNLYRSYGNEPEFLLNAELIPSAVPPGSPFGANYSWLDQDVASGIKYYYWLEDVEMSGAATRHGPVLEGINLPASENPDRVVPPEDPLPAAEPPPPVPEASTLILLGSAASGLAGYVTLQIRARGRS